MNEQPERNNYAKKRPSMSGVFFILVILFQFGLSFLTSKAQADGAFLGLSADDFGSIQVAGNIAFILWLLAMIISTALKRK